MTNVTSLRDTTLKEYRIYKIEVIVEEDEYQEALEAVIPYGISPPISYQVRWRPTEETWWEGNEGPWSQGIQKTE